MFTNIVFDFDGTIVESRYLAVNLLNKLAAKYGFRKIKEEELEKYRSLTLLERCRAVNVPVYLIPMIYMELKNNYRDNINQLALNNGLRNVFWSLRQKGYKLSIISSNSAHVIENFCKNNSIDFFDIYSSRSYMGKDWTIKSFLRKNNLSEKEIIYIGDEYRDIVACKKINVKIISVTWGFDSAELLATGKPDYIANNPGEILKILNQGL